MKKIRSHNVFWFMEECVWEKKKEKAKSWVTYKRFWGIHWITSCNIYNPLKAIRLRKRWYLLVCLSIPASDEITQTHRASQEAEPDFSNAVTGADILRMSREDLIQICGPADGIRLFNTMKGRWDIRINFTDWLCLNIQEFYSGFYFSMHSHKTATTTMVRKPERRQ